MEVSGVVSAKSDAAATMVMSQRLLAGRPWIALLCGFVAAAFAFLGAGGLHTIAPAESLGLWSLVASGLIMTVAVVGLSQVQRDGLLRAWADRGVAYPATQTLRIAADGLHVSNPLLSASSAWVGVSEITRSPDGWLIILSGMGCNVPSSFFEDQAAERAFVRALLERMGEAARDRSRQATDFVGVWG